MRPVLLELLGYPIHSYGLFLGLTFLVGSLLTWRQLPRHRIDPALVLPVTALAVSVGLVGGKLAAVADNWSRFLADPLGFLLGGAGFAYLGGFLLATAAIWLYLRSRGVPFLRFADATAPGLAFGYGVARIGCQLAGDGDYGVASDLPWAMSYPNGMVPIHETVHPTPVYETLGAFALGALLLRLGRGGRELQRRDGWLFSLYLVISAATRLLVEIVRRNPRWALGLTQAQWISVGLILLGLFSLWRLRRRALTDSSG